VSDKSKPDSTARRAGRWFARMLGRDTIEKLSDSAKALRDEFERGREEAKDPEPKKVPHRVVEEEEEPAG